jgi:hypothetical protein
MQCKKLANIWDSSRYADADMLYTIEMPANTTGKEGGKSYFCYGK